MAEMKADNVFKLKKKAPSALIARCIYTAVLVRLGERWWSQKCVGAYLTVNTEQKFPFVLNIVLWRSHRLRCWITLTDSQLYVHAVYFTKDNFQLVLRGALYTVCTYMNVHILLKGQSWAQIQVAYKYKRPRYTHIYLIMFMLGQSILTAVYLVNWKDSE